MTATPHPEDQPDTRCPRGWTDPTGEDCNHGKYQPCGHLETSRCETCRGCTYCDGICYCGEDY